MHGSRADFPPRLTAGTGIDGKCALSEDQASDLGLRPRRATAAPGIPPAQESQRSAAFAPRRASLNVTRSTAPFPSSTSLPQESQTRTVFRATIDPPMRKSPMRFSQVLDYVDAKMIRNISGVILVRMRKHPHH